MKPTGQQGRWDMPQEACVVLRSDLAHHTGVSQRTISRYEAKLGLIKVPSGNRAVAYKVTGTVQDLIQQLNPSYRRDGSLRESIVPEPQFVCNTITSTCGPQSGNVIHGCLLTLSKLSHMSLGLDGEAGIQIKAHRLQKLVGSRICKQIIECLKRAGLIEKVRGYTKGVRCNSYRLTDASMSRLESHLLWWPDVPDAQQESEFIEEIASEDCPFDRTVLSRIKKDSRAFTLPSDLDIEAIAGEHAERAVRKAEKRSGRSFSAMTAEGSRRCSYWACVTAYRRYLDDPVSLFRIGQESQRLFHPIAMMPRLLRAELRCHGERITTLDISCCQPFLLGLLLESDGAHRIEASELEDYRELTRSGRFYEALGEQCQTVLTREEIKILCYRDLFFGHRASHRTEIVAIFNSMFPTMGAALDGLRRMKGYSLARELQRREAALIIGRVLPALQRSFPAHPLTIVHDAVLVPTEIAAKAKRLMAEKILRATGRRAEVKEERHGPVTRTHIGYPICPLGPAPDITETSDDSRTMSPRRKRGSG